MKIIKAPKNLKVKVDSRANDISQIRNLKRVVDKVSKS